MKKLPKIYQNEITKKINNNEEVFYSSRENKVIVDDYQEESIDEILRSVFNGIGYSFNIPLIIETTTKTYETSLIGRTKNYLITFDNDTIPLGSIKKIQKKNPK